MFQKVLWRNQTPTFCVQNFFREDRAVHEIMWREKKSRARQAAVDNITWGKRFACCITKPTDPHQEYVVLNAFLRQQRLCERALILRYTYIAVLF
jgi:hypothetical protein